MTKYDWTLTIRDFARAEIGLKYESIERNKKSMFRGTLYAVLSTTELFSKQLKVYRHLLENGFDNPYMINKVQTPGCISCLYHEILTKTRFPNQKIKRIRDLSRWWQKSDLPDRIIDDINRGRKNEFGLRTELAKECPGLALKASSLLFEMLGYENVIPIDLWILRYLNYKGYKFPVPDYKTVSGLRDDIYLDAEKHLIEISKEYQRQFSGHVNVTPAVFQFALWSENAPWNLPLHHFGEQAPAIKRIRNGMTVRERAVAVSKKYVRWHDPPKPAHVLKNGETLEDYLRSKV